MKGINLRWYVVLTLVILCFLGGMFGVGVVIASSPENWVSQLHVGELKADTLETPGWPVPSTGGDLSNMGVRLSNVASQSLPNNTWMALNWDTEVYDPEDLHTSSDPTAIIVREAGMYVGTVNICFTKESSNGYRCIEFRLNNTMTPSTHTVKAVDSIYTYMSVPVMWHMTANSKLQVYVWQNSGTTINMYHPPGCPCLPGFSLQKVGQ